MTITLDSTVPLALDRALILYLTPDLSAEVLRVDDSYWDHRADRPELRAGRIVSVFDYTHTWNWWERHPVGDEFLMLLSGSVTVQLDNDRGLRTIPLDPSDGIIVPQGAWHRARINEPSRMLFITPTPARTEQRPASD